MAPPPVSAQHLSQCCGSEQGHNWVFPSLSSQDYTVRGLLGKATDDFREDGRLVEKTTYGESTWEPRACGGAAEAASAFAFP